MVDPILQNATNVLMASQPESFVASTRGNFCWAARESVAAGLGGHFCFIALITFHISVISIFYLYVDGNVKTQS